VEEYTLQKAANLVLNVDGCIGALFLDLLHSSGCFSQKEMDDIISVGYLNGLFVLARSIGLIGHALDQKRLQQPLYRHPWEDVLCECGGGWECVVMLPRCMFSSLLEWAVHLQARRGERAVAWSNVFAQHNCAAVVVMVDRYCSASPSVWNLLQFLMMSSHAAAALFAALQTLADCMEANSCRAALLARKHIAACGSYCYGC
jgi:hypothetical protein